MPKVHAPHPCPGESPHLHALYGAAADDPRRAWCGRLASTVDHLGAEAAAVTCGDCNRLIDRDGVEAAFASGFEPYLIERVRRGARELDEHGRRAIAASQAAPSLTARPWASSAEAAVKRWVRVRDEGAALRSTCDPDRANRVQTSNDPSLGGREHAAVEQVATVTRALDIIARESDGGSELPMLISEACPTVTPRQARDIYLLLIVGRQRARPTRVGPRTPHQTRVTMSARDLVEHLRADHGLRLCHHDAAECGAGGGDSCAAVAVQRLQRLRRLCTRVVWIALRDSGELRGRPRTAAPRRGGATRFDPFARVGTGE